MLPVAEFGRTGHRSTRVIFGAAGLGSMSRERVDETLALIAARGVNHVDTAASYGTSEDLLRPWLATHRKDVFLATKTGERAGAAARAELERSLERMGVDRVDLIQLHNLVEPDEWDVAFASDGAVEALAAARDEGLVRFIGITGHGLRIAEMHRRSLECFDFDSVLLPYNYSLMQIVEYRADFEALRQLCAERNVAVQTIKAVARRRWQDADASHYSWYEPLSDPGAIDRATCVRAGRARPVPQQHQRRPAVAAPVRCRVRRARRSRATARWPPIRTRSTSVRSSTASRSNASDRATVSA